MPSPLPTRSNFGNLSSSLGKVFSFSSQKGPSISFISLPKAAKAFRDDQPAGLPCLEVKLFTALVNGVSSNGVS